MIWSSQLKNLRILNLVHPPITFLKHAFSRLNKKCVWKREWMNESGIKKQQEFAPGTPFVPSQSQGTRLKHACFWRPLHRNSYLKYLEKIHTQLNPTCTHYLFCVLLVLLFVFCLLQALLYILTVSSFTLLLQDFTHVFNTKKHRSCFQVICICLIGEN